MPYLVVCAVGLFFAGDLLTFEFCVGLCGAENIVGEFFAPHMIEDLLAFLESFARMNIFCSKPAIEAHVSMVLKNSKV